MSGPRTMAVDVRRLPHYLMLACLLATALTGLMVAAGRPAHGAMPCQRTFSSGTVNWPIHAGAATAVQIIVPDSFDVPVGDVEVMLDIEHLRTGDLELAVRADGPYGAHYAVLSTLRGGLGNHFSGTTFDDEAASPISAGSAPFTGSFRPETPLDVFDAHAAAGQWRLVIYDQAAFGASGQVISWSVTIRAAGACDLDGDGVEDHVDNCLDFATSNRQDTDGDGAGNACDANDDNDGLVDHADACSVLTGLSASGCPLVGRSLSAKFRLGKFKGVASSPVAACNVGRPVTIWRQRPGPDRNVGTAVTRADGSYVLKRPRRRGFYYATSPGFVVPNEVECAATNSPRFRIR